MITDENGDLAKCPKHPNGFERSCPDVRCTQMWKPEGAPTSQEQLERWVLGDAICPNEFHQCTPDFGCCNPKLLWPEEKRRKFMNASDGERDKMMMGGLSGLIENMNVRITRGNPVDEF